MDFQISDLGQHHTLHDRPALVILDVPYPAVATELDLLGEALFLEVPDGIVVGIREEVIDRWVGSSDVVFERVHEV